MILPSITTDIIRERMREVWFNADIAHSLNHTVTVAQMLREYDYLSNYQSEVAVNAILSNCSQ